MSLPAAAAPCTLAAAGIALCGCAATPAPESTIALAAAAPHLQPGSEGVFGEWVSQIIRTPAKDAAGAPTFETASIYDEAFRESRPMLALTLSDDGTFALISSYATNSRSIAFGTWSMTGNKVALEQSGDVAWVFSNLGGKLVADKTDGPTIILGRR